MASGEARLRQQRDRKLQRVPKGVRGVRRRVRSFWLTEVQEHWPALDGGLSMECEGAYCVQHVHASQFILCVTGQSAESDNYGSFLVSGD